MVKHGDKLYDSARVAHDTRWDLPLLARNETLKYMERVLDRVIEQAITESGSLEDAQGYDQDYFLNLVLLHEQMHDEAIAYTRQTLSYPEPAMAAVNNVRFAEDACLTQNDNDLTHDAKIAGGRFTLGSAPKQGFMFDNEQMGHEVDIGPFAISKTAVTNGEFRAFVEDGAIKGAISGLRKPGSGEPPSEQNIRSTGAERETSGCGATSMNGSHWMSVSRSSM